MSGLSAVVWSSGVYYLRESGNEFYPVVNESQQDESRMITESLGRADMPHPSEIKLYNAQTFDIFKVEFKT